MVKLQIHHLALSWNSCCVQSVLRALSQLILPVASSGLSVPSGRTGRLYSPSSACSAGADSVQQEVVDSVAMVTSRHAQGQICWETSLETAQYAQDLEP